jgi:N-acetylglucosamine-6-phosphate deacetylase
MRPPFAVVDLQINGGWGVDFAAPDVTLAELRDCCDAVLASGTAAFLPTLVSSPMEVYRRNLPLLVRLLDEPALRGRALGIHLEGPFLAADERVLGAHRRDHVSPHGTTDLAELLELSGGHLRMLTVAAERPDAREIIATATGRGVTVSVGHSFFTAADLRSAADAGARALTHLGNALPGALDKQDNPFYAGLLADDLTACFIADGHHLSEAALRLLLRCKPPDRLVAVSDAAPVAGLPPGRYHALGQPVVLAEDGRLVNPAENHLVASTASLLDCLNHLLRLGLCDPADCERIGGTNPLALLDLSPAALPPDGPRVAYDRETRSLAPARGAPACP